MKSIKELIEEWEDNRDMMGYKVAQILQQAQEYHEAQMIELQMVVNRLHSHLDRKDKEIEELKMKIKSFIEGCKRDGYISKAGVKKIIQRSGLLSISGEKALLEELGISEDEA